MLENVLILFCVFLALPEAKFWNLEISLHCSTLDIFADMMFVTTTGATGSSVIFFLIVFFLLEEWFILLVTVVASDIFGMLCWEDRKENCAGDT